VDSTDSPTNELPEDLRAIYDAERALPAVLPAEARARILDAVAHAVPVAAAGFSLVTVIAASLISAVIGAAIAVSVISLRGNDAVAPTAATIDAAPSHDMSADAAPFVEAADAAPVVEAADAAPVLDAPPAVRASRHREDAGSVATEAPDTTTAERNLIDRARSALSRGKAHEAMIALMEHERTYAAGTMLEEREYLIIVALLAQNKRDVATTRAASYRRNFPRGSYLDAITRVLGE
jgi:hypothetical protein